MRKLKTNNHFAKRVFISKCHKCGKDCDSTLPKPFDKTKKVYCSGCFEEELDKHPYSLRGRTTVTKYEREE